VGGQEVQQSVCVVSGPTADHHGVEGTARLQGSDTTAIIVLRSLNWLMSDCWFDIVSID
jgi:hypothetical protein